MFSQIAHDEKNNIYCWFDYCGVPSRWVELCGRHVNRYTHAEMDTVKKASEKGVFDSFLDIKEPIKEGYLKGYWMRHLFPLGMGGTLYGKSFSNICMMPKKIAENYHRFLRGWYYGSLLFLPKRIAANGHKIFFNVPILPAVITDKDVPFLEPLNDILEVKKHDDFAVRGHDVLVAMQEKQNQNSTVPIELRFSPLNKLSPCIYPPQSLAEKIQGTQTIAGGPTCPELLITKNRELVLPPHVRQRS